MSIPAASAKDGLSRFADTISAVSPTFDLLYGTHICDLYRARSALEEGRLKPQHCKRFNEEQLLYIFYGKPAYRPKSTKAGNRFSFNFPVCFVVNLTAVIAWKRVFPFDTGAFPDRYAEFFQEEMRLDDFLMPPDADSARRVVEGFFRSNLDYYNSKPIDQFRARKTMESQAYYEMIRAFGSGQKLDGDDRLVAIELQATNEVVINQGNIVRLLVPDRALELEDVNAALAGCAIPFSTYETGAVGLHECHGMINRAVREINRL